MTRQKGEENLTDQEVKVLDLTDEWHYPGPGSPSLDMSLIEWVAQGLEVTNREAEIALYGPHARRDDGAVL